MNKKRAPISTSSTSLLKEESLSSKKYLNVDDFEINISGIRYNTSAKLITSDCVHSMYEVRLTNIKHTSKLFTK